MNDWLDLDNSSAMSIAIVTEIIMKDTGKVWMAKRSENPSDYVELISFLLKQIRVAMKQHGYGRRVFKIEKDNEVSAKLREEGNKVFLSSSDLKSLEYALQLYTRSIANAIPNTEALGLAYANRSAVLLKLKQPEESLKDIERALNSNCPENSKVKLFIRKADCYSMLVTHSLIQAKFWLSEVLANDPSKKDMENQLRGYSAKEYENVIDEEPILPKIESPSSKFPCASDALDVEYSGYAGKKIVATRDIGVAEVLVVEKPYATYLDLKNSYLYCSHCLQPFFAGIPCDQCTQTLYCSTDCKFTAWNRYHKFECPVLDMLRQYSKPTKTANEDFDGTNFKLMNDTIATAKLFIHFLIEAGGLKALRGRVENFHRNNDGRLRSDWYGSSTLESILTLHSNIIKIDSGQLMVAIFVAIRTLFYLATTTDLLGTQYKREWMPDEDIVALMSKNPDILFVGGLLVKLSLISNFHSFTATERIPSFLHMKCRGKMTLPFTSLITFTCDYNVIGKSIGDHAFVTTVAPIKRGETVVFTLNDSWRTVPKDKRHATLQGLLVECSCRACEENWPTVYENELKSFNERAKTAEIRAKLQVILKPLPGLQKKINSGKIENKDEVLRTLKKMMEAVCEGVNLPCIEHARLLDALTFFYYHTGPTSKLHYIEADRKMDFTKKHP